MSFPALVQAAGEGRAIALPALGIAMTVRLAAAATGGQLCLIEERTAPGRGPPRHVHEAQTEIFHFLEGSYAMEVDGQRFAAGPGTVALVPPGLPHAFRNIGTTPGRFLFLLTPAGTGEAMFDTLAAMTAAGPPDPAALALLAAEHGTRIVGPPL